MCLMHDSDEYGVLRWTIAEIAQALRVKPAIVTALAKAGVMKGADAGPVEPLTYTPKTNNKKWPEVILLPATEGPIWYSSRMVKDEHVRNARANNAHTEGSTEALTEGDTKGLTKVVTKVAINGPLSANFPANSKQQPKQGRDVTTLSQGKEGEPW